MNNISGPFSIEHLAYTNVIRKLLRKVTRRSRLSYDQQLTVALDFEKRFFSGRREISMTKRSIVCSIQLESLLIAISVDRHVE